MLSIWLQLWLNDAIDMAKEAVLCLTCTAL